MMKKIVSFILLPAFLLSGCAYNSGKRLLDFVNPFIGTDGHGHTYPGAAYPFGMVQLSPDTRKDNWDACSGYHYSDSTILGFSHTHLSGTGVGDYGDIRFMPVTGQLQIRPGEEGVKGSGYRSSFSHKNETASPGYYRVFLDDYGVDAELTVGRRCGLHRYTFPESNDAYVVIDLKESVVTESDLELQVNIISHNEISGYRKSSGWADDQRIYFYASFSRPFDSFGTASDGQITEGSEGASGQDIQVFVKYSTEKQEKIVVKVGVSGVSVENAKQNVMNEIPEWDFDKLKKQAEMKWAEELGKTVVKGGSTENRIKFYTALYHCYLAPNVFSDLNGEYRGHDGVVHTVSEGDIYTVFSLWDTYRALHPLMTILQPGITADFINTFIDIYNKSGLLPVWELAGNETNCMIGYHAVPVIVDAYIKGITGFDPLVAYEAMKNSAMQDHFGLKYYRSLGYIPAEAEGESISKTLEYAYDDWCIALMAKRLGKEDDFRKFIERAQYYKNIYDPESGFLRGKRNGMFTQPFDPSEVNFMLTEANTWQYTFYVPHDLSGLSDLMGGDAAFEKKLDEMFSSQSALSGRQQADITGLIGQYAHGNEPSHHMTYLYNYIGKPYKTQKLVRQIMEDLYGSGPDGLCGNEDCGQMSAWFVMSAMGLYPVAPGSGYYVIGSPLFDEISIKHDDGSVFTIEAKSNNNSNIYISSTELNGQALPKSYLSHETLMQDGHLSFTMSSRPNTDWASDLENRPVSAITEHLITPLPYFIAKSNAFQDKMSVKLGHVHKDAVIIYAIVPNKLGFVYRPGIDSIQVAESIRIRASATSSTGVESKTVFAQFKKIHRNWKVFYKEPYNSQYTAGGDMALIDGQYGGPNFRTGSWQGYHGNDLDVTIDMGRNQGIREIAATFLHDQRSWIFLPERVEFMVSDKNYDFRTVAIIENRSPSDLSEAFIEEFKKDRMKEYGRYVRIRAINRKTCPEWHVGAGEKAWIFIDELVVE